MLLDEKGYRIFVIEDNPGDFRIVDEYIKEKMQNAVITVSRTFKEALVILSAAELPFHVIFLDLTLPDKSGSDLVLKILELAVNTPIIVLTGFADVDFGIKSIAMGVSDYLLKDELTPAILYKSMVYAIERKRMFSELIESEKRYSDLFQLSPQPMWVYDIDSFQCIQVNDAAMKEYGYSKDEFLKMKISELEVENSYLLSGNQMASVVKFKKALSSHRKFHVKKSGEVIEVELYNNKILINNKVYQSVIAIDVTQKNLVEDQIVKAIIKTQEDERYEIGGELHDNVCQILASSLISLSMLKKSVDPVGLQWYNQGREYITLALKEIRNLSHRVAPSFFEETTLEETFNKLLKAFDVEGKYDIFPRFDESIKLYPISLEIQLNLYRILQEQLRNIIQYADAKSIEVEVLIQDNNIRMRVLDDGIGFIVEELKGGIGFANMRRRAELFAGRFEVDSSPGKGCKIEIDIPLQGVN